MTSSDAAPAANRPNRSSPPNNTIYSDPKWLMAPLLVLMLGLFLVMLLVDNTQRKEALQQRQLLEMRNAVNVLRGSLGLAVNDLHYLARQTHLHSGVHRAADYSGIARLFADFARQKPYLSQIRLLGSDGRERVRVERKHGAPSFNNDAEPARDGPAPNNTEQQASLTIVTEDQLQDKSHRYYFEALRGLQHGEVYRSPMDLNVENGIIETPIRPMVRYGTPVEASGDSTEYLILNVGIADVLGAMRDQRRNETVDFILVNRNGEYLLHPSVENAWEMGTAGNRPNLADDNPELWTALSNGMSQSGVMLGNFWYTSTRLCVVSDTCQSAPTTSHFAVDASDLPWYVVARSAKGLQGYGAWLTDGWALLVMALFVAVFTFAAILTQRLSEAFNAQTRQRTLLERANNRFSALLDATPDGMVISDDTSVIRWVNAAALKLFDLDASQAVGAPVHKLWPEHLIALGDNPPIPVQSANGNALQVGIAMSSITIDDEQLNIFSIRDVTQEIRQAVIAKQREKLEALGKLVGGVAHDFNNLLGIIMGNAEIIERKHRDIPDVQTRTARILRSANSAAELTQKLLVVSRKKQQEPITLDLDAWMQETMPLLIQAVKAKCEISFEGLAQTSTITIDPEQLLNALINMCVNASDASQSGDGLIQITTENVQLSDDYIRTIPEPIDAGVYVKLTITDNGTGIPPELIERVLEPFFTTKEEGKGTGLGLAMVYGFVKQSHGHMRIYSEVGYGTSIHIYLPLQYDDNDLDALAADHALPETIDLTGKRVLIVDDEPDFADMTQNLLSMSGAHCDVAYASSLAKEKLAQGNYDILISDVVMPGGDGVELIRDIDKDYPTLAIVLCSGFAETILQTRQTLPKRVQFIGKPFSREDLLLTISKALHSPK